MHKGERGEFKNASTKKNLETVGINRNIAIWG